MQIVTVYFSFFLRNGVKDYYFLKSLKNLGFCRFSFISFQCHMKAQKRGKEQQLDIMNKQYKQLESRLDEVLSRIAKETEEIKDLEQQLTEGENLSMI